MEVHLKFNKGFKWYKNCTVFFKGFFYIHNIFYEKENALKYLSKADDFHVLLQNITGVFTILKKEHNGVFVFADLTRSFPVFYTIQNNEFFLSDDIYYLKTKFKLHNFDSVSETVFKASNHTYGNSTLLKDVYQIQASECLEIKYEKIVKSDFKYSYANNEENKANYTSLKENTITAFENSFKRLISSLKNKTVVIPLSGGFDSRLIAVMLKKHNYTNVVCYTYGKKSSFEIENSKKTADLLDFKWHFIEYKKDLINGFLDSEEFKEYAHYAAKLSSMPNLQEYFAVKYLKEFNLIPDDAVFIPGYAGDILGGSEYSKNIPENINDDKLATTIFEKKMINYHFKNNEKRDFLKQIEQNIYQFNFDYNQKQTETILDDHNIKERIAKYIFNSASFYTFFDFEFRFPFWDKELLDLFKETPVQFKKNKSLYNDVLIHTYFKPFNVYFDNELQSIPQKMWKQKIKKQLKPFLPTFIKEKKVSSNDWNNYKIITSKMLIFLEKKGVKVKRSYNDYNEIITQWYIYISKNGFD